MSLTSPMPPRTSSILTAVQALLVASADLTTLLGGVGRIFVGKGDLVDNNPPGGNYWNRLVVMAQTGPMGARDYMDRVINYHFNVRVDIKPPKDAGFDPDLTYQAISERVFLVLEGQYLNLPAATMGMQLMRERRSRSVFYDRDRGWYFGADTYRTILKAKEAV